MYLDFVHCVSASETDMGNKYGTVSVTECKSFQASDKTSGIMVKRKMAITFVPRWEKKKVTDIYLKRLRGGKKGRDSVQHLACTIWPSVNFRVYLMRVYFRALNSLWNFCFQLIFEFI